MARIISLLLLITASFLITGCNRAYNDSDTILQKELPPLDKNQITDYKDVLIKPKLIGGDKELKRLLIKYKKDDFIGKIDIEFIVDKNGRTRDLIILGRDSLANSTIDAVRLIIGNLKYQPGKDIFVTHNTKMKQTLYFEEVINQSDSEYNKIEEDNVNSQKNNSFKEIKITRPVPIGEKEIDEFMKKAFDVYDSTNSASNKIRNIDQKIQEMVQIQNIVANPVSNIKKEAKLIENSVMSLKTQSEELIGLSQNVLKSASKVKFTKIASATRNIKSSIEAVTVSADILLKLVADIPEILKKIAEFEKANNIVSTENESETATAPQNNSRIDTNSSNNTVNAKSSIITVNEAEVVNLTPEFGQIIYTKDTKKLLFFDGEKFKKIILDDWK